MSQNKNNKAPTYTLLVHEALQALGISANEYCVVDTIDHLVNSSGWCYASKEYLGKCIGVSKQAIISLIKRMKAQHFLEQDPNNRANLRSTKTWKECVYPLRKRINGKETLPSPVNNLSSQGTVSLLNKNNLNKEKIKSDFSTSEKQALFSSLEELNIILAPSKILYPDERAIRILKKFSDLCLDRAGMRPVMETDCYYSVKKASQRLDDRQILVALKDWFTCDDNYEGGNIVHITRALSTKRINTLQAEDPDTFASKQKPSVQEPNSLS